MKKPLFIIAGTNSGCGKTTVTLGIIHSLVKKKLKTSAFKIGPDYIDPSYHKAITAKPGCNLDSWMMSKETICHLINKNMELSDIGVIEGVMGLYDGISGNEYPRGSSAHIAEILQIPVILVVNAKGLAHSIVPIINGFKIHGKKRPWGRDHNFAGKAELDGFRRNAALRVEARDGRDQIELPLRRTNKKKI